MQTLLISIQLSMLLFFFGRQLNICYYQLTKLFKLTLISYAEEPKSLNYTINPFEHKLIKGLTMTN